MKHLTGLLVAAVACTVACGSDSGSTNTGVQVFMPDGQQATVEELDASGFPGQENLVSGVYDIGPSGTQFDVPVTIGLPISPSTAADTTIVVMRFDEANSVWEPLEGSTIIGTTVFAQTEHFSIFAALSSAEAAVCGNIWQGVPGNVPRFLMPDNIAVSGGVRTEESLANNGASKFALDSTWTVDGCSATVTGFFDPNTTSAGKWKDWSNAGGGGPIPRAADGSFSFDLNYPDGPFLGLMDPCNAASDSVSYNLNVAFTGDCVDRCLGVTCTGNTGNVCTAKVCNPSNGLCEVAPSAGTCGSGSAGKCVEGQCVVEVPMVGGESGTSICAAQGMTCQGTPVFASPEAACLTFHPSANVTTSASGWKQGIYCNDNDNAGCGGKLNNCHSCPACLDTGLGCGLATSSQIEAIYATCVP